MKKLRVGAKEILVIPAVLVMLGVLIFPLIFSVKTSLYNYVLSNPLYRPFIGLENYRSVLHDKQIYNSIWVTIKYTVTAVTLELVFGFILALVLTKIKYFRNIFLSILMIPMMITPIAVGLIWKMILHPDLGIFNYLLSVVGLVGRPWLGLSETALITLILIDVWQWTPFILILMYAGLLSLPQEPFEAIELDGGNYYQKLIYLVFPMLKNVILIAVVIRIIDTLRAYDLVYILTRGGPGNSTETFSFYVFKLAFTNLNMGQASAASILFLISIIFASNYLFKMLQRSD